METQSSAQEKKTEPVRSYKRRQFLINAKFQFIITGYFAGLALLSLGSLYWAAHLLFGEMVAQIEASGTLRPLLTASLLTMKDRAITLFVVGSCLVLILLVVGGIALSFRIAGPVYHMKKHMADLIAGDTRSSMQFRKNDFFHDLADQYNKLLEHLRSRKG